MPNKDLRDWIAELKANGQVETVTGADREEEIGAIVDIAMRKMTNPAVLFDDVPGYPKGYRVLANILSALAFAGSILIKRPLMGVIIGPIMGTGMRWRQDPDLLKAYSRVTWLWAILSLVRAAIQIPLIQAGQLAWLGATPFLFYGLVALTIAASWWVIKKTLPPDHPGIRRPVVSASA